MLIKFIHAKFYANAIAIYNASKMNTHEFIKLLGFEAGAHSPFHTPTGSATWYVIQFRARTAILAAESRTQRMWACPINVRSRCHCPACRTTLVATRFRVAVICPIIQVPHCIRVFFYFVWFVFINHIFQFYYELCTYCNILDIYLS